MSNPGSLEQTYAMRVVADEIGLMDELVGQGRGGSLKEAMALQNFPDVARFLTRPRAQFVLRHVQNLCWTMRRWARQAGPGPRRPASRTTHAPRAPRLGAGVIGRPRPQIWIDMTHTFRDGFNGGISRVTLKLAEAASQSGSALPIFIEGGEAYEFIAHRYKGRRLQFTPDVTLVLADCFWAEMEQTRSACRKARTAGAKVVVGIHDVIPFYYPSFSSAELQQQFVAAFDEIIELADACIAVSKYSADKVESVIRDRGLRRDNPLPVTHFHLGGDGLVGVDPSRANPRLQAIFARNNVFVSVGTVEPRKGYAVSLDAFDALWAQGVEARFVILGKSGWRSKALERRIIRHPRYGTHLHWIDAASDADIAFAYRNAHCVLQASVTEGFGLPVSEAAYLGTPVIASDTPVFREIGGDAFTYFRNCDCGDLTFKLKAAVARRPMPRPVRCLTWAQSLEQMVTRVCDLLDLRDSPLAPRLPPRPVARQAFAQPRDLMEAII